MTVIDYKTCNDIIYDSIKTCLKKFYKRCTTLLHKTLIDILMEIKGNLSISKDMSSDIKRVKVIKT